MNQPDPWTLPPGPVLRALKRAAGSEIGPEDFTDEEHAERELFLRGTTATTRDTGKGKHRR